MKKAKGPFGGPLPKGFRGVSTSGNFPDAWNPQTEGETLEGVVMSKRIEDAKKLGRQNAKKGDKVTIITVADGDGVLRSVWESHALKELCAQAKPKDHVFIRFDGVKKLGKKRLKLFTAGFVGK